MTVTEAVKRWAEASTKATSAERAKILKFKQGVVKSFFDETGAKLTKATSAHVRAWRAQMEKKLSPKSVYDRIVFLSSFFEWRGGNNPVESERPAKPPSRERAAHALTTRQLARLLSVIKEQAETGDLIAKRDYAMLLLHMVTGMRRKIFAALRTSDIRLSEGSLTISYPTSAHAGKRTSDGRATEHTVFDEEVIDALVNYLSATERLGQTDKPIWTRHERPKESHESLTFEAFLHNFKLHAKRAGQPRLQPNQVRRLYASKLYRASIKKVLAQEQQKQGERGRKNPAPQAA